MKYDMKHGICCNVESCVYNDGRENCSRENITVSCCPQCGSGKAQDESMCSSYEAQR